LIPRQGYLYRKMALLKREMKHLKETEMLTFLIKGAFLIKREKEI
jgi:hypothetical protein